MTDSRDHHETRRKDPVIVERAQQWLKSILNGKNIAIVVGGVMAVAAVFLVVDWAYRLASGGSRITSPGGMSVDPSWLIALVVLAVVALLWWALPKLRGAKAPTMSIWGVLGLLAVAVLVIYLMSIGTEGLQNRWTLATETLSWEYGNPAKWAVLVLFGVATLVAALKSDLSFGEKAAALGAWALVFLIIGPHLVRADWPNTSATAHTAPAYTPAVYTPPTAAYTSCHETSTKLVGARGTEINPYAGPTGKRCSSRFVIEGNRGCLNVKRYGRAGWEPHEFCADRPNVSLPRDVQFIRSTTGPLTVHVKLVPPVIN